MLRKNNISFIEFIQIWNNFKLKIISKIILKANGKYQCKYKILL